MKLEEIGFYTLSDKRAENTSVQSPLWRCELIVTDKCNFQCPYCRGLREDCLGEMPTKRALDIMEIWIKDDLQNIRFSGGEPTLHSGLCEMVYYARNQDVKRIAISTNGSADFEEYQELISYGVNDISISLDACCSAFGERMNGGKGGMWEKSVENIGRLSELVYVTVGMVFTPKNFNQSKESIEFAHSLGVADIRILSSAQYNKAIKGLDSLSEEILNVHPILKYRVDNFRNRRNVRGLQKEDCDYCHLVLDDMAIAGDSHFPCIIYLREGGKPIGKTGIGMRQERYRWWLNHNSHKDQICKQNCLDVCIDYNNRADMFGKLNANR